MSSAPPAVTYSAGLRGGRARARMIGTPRDTNGLRGEGGLDVPVVDLLLIRSVLRYGC